MKAETEIDLVCMSKSERKKFRRKYWKIAQRQAIRQSIREYWPKILLGMFSGWVIVNIFSIVMMGGAPKGYNFFFPFLYFDIGLFLLWIVASMICSITWYITFKK